MSRSICHWVDAQANFRGRLNFPGIMQHPNCPLQVRGSCFWRLWDAGRQVIYIACHIQALHLISKSIAAVDHGVHSGCVRIIRIADVGHAEQMEEMGDLGDCINQYHHDCGLLCPCRERCQTQQRQAAQTTQTRLCAVSAKRTWYSLRAWAIGDTATD